MEPKLNVTNIRLYIGSILGILYRLYSSLLVTIVYFPFRGKYTYTLPNKLCNKLGITIVDISNKLPEYKIDERIRKTTDDEFLETLEKMKYLVNINGRNIDIRSLPKNIELVEIGGIDIETDNSTVDSTDNT